MNCRFCGASVTATAVDLGMQPLSNAYISREACDAMEPFYPLHARLCERCFLVQLPELQSPERIFGDYAYLSSVSESWLAHCQRYAGAMVDRFALGPRSLVVEVASNDGYLLRFFREAGVPVLGIEPAANVAAIAESKGIRTLPRFFGSALAKELTRDGPGADLLVGNNVLAHVPNVNDFVAGLKTMLAPSGVLTMEFPHLAKLVEENQFDTIYHEHFSYFSFGTAEELFAAHGLVVFDVDEIPTHGGSLRIYARHAERAGEGKSERVARLRAAEDAAGLRIPSTYTAFAERVNEVKRSVLEFLIDCKRRGKRVVGYGAAAKGNTLLNFCGIRADFVDYVADKNPLKQGKFLPGSHLPVVGPERIAETRPDYILIFPWNIKDEVAHQLDSVRAWGGKFVVPIPRLEILP